MIYALWNGELLNVDDISQTEETETKIRIASTHKELRCKDPNCTAPVVCYKHGAKRGAHFAHISKGNCDYADFDKNDTSVVRDARGLLFQHFANLGYDVQREQKLPNSRRYCHLIFHIGDRNIVLHIAQSTTPATDIKTMTEECEKSGYELIWIVLGNSDDIQYEKENYHAMRYTFNHSAKKDLLILDIGKGKISQTRWDDKTNYSYKGRLMSQYGGQDVHLFREVKNVNKLRIINGNLTLEGFDKRFDDWTKTKDTAFQEMKQRIDLEFQRINEPPKSILPKTTHPKSPTLKPPTKAKKQEYPPLSESVLKQFEVGMLVHHRIFGKGEIVGIDFTTQKVKIKYSSHNVVREHSLAQLVGADTLKKV